MEKQQQWVGFTTVEYTESLSYKFYRILGPDFIKAQIQDCHLQVWSRHFPLYPTTMDTYQKIGQIMLFLVDLELINILKN